MMEDFAIPMNREEMIQLYDPQSLQLMITAEESLDPGIDRLHEIKNFARKADIKRIGIAYCISFPKEAKAIQQFLSDEFEVFTVDCKYGRITEQELLGGNSKGTMCNPAGQAEYLKKNKTGLNLSMGLCVGHDMIFNQKSGAPVTTVIIKDRVNRQNPMDSIRNLKHEE